MEIKLNKKQYKAMLKALYLSSIVLKAYRPKMMEKEIEQEKMLVELLANAGEFGLGHWVRVGNAGKMELTEEKEFDIYEAMEEFEQLTFWNELAYRLAQRDVEEVLSDEDILSMEIQKELDMEMEIQEKYEQEFNDNGLQNLRLISPKNN